MGIGTAFNSINQRATIIVSGVLFLVAGFTIVRFLLNFDQLQRLAEENSGTRAVEAPPSTEASSAAAVASPGAAPATLALNYAPQLPDLRLGAEAHTEDSAKPGFSAEGAAAARASDVDWMWDPHSRPQPPWAIDNWMQVPFHRLQIINPYLHSVGYGTYCQDAACFAALNTGTDIDPLSTLPSPWPKPLVFPPDGSVMDAGAFSGEWPDPLTSCPGYTLPAGLPVTLELGRSIEPGFSDYSIKEADGNASIEACAFDANTYVNPDTAAQTTARAILRHFGAIILVPRHPLSAGRYVVALTAGQRYSWSFSIAPRDHE